MEQRLGGDGSVVAGVDEAGRGSLAGPVVAAAVILQEDHPIVGLKDSKLLSQRQRERLAAAIRQRARAFAVASATPKEIDDVNILQATLRAMERAVDRVVARLGMTPDLVQVDGAQVPRFADDERICAEAVVGGDRLIPAISAASILAKVCRDRLMRQLHRHHPDYGFDSNKGYPTAVHLAALRRFGPCAIHRMSYAPVRKACIARAGDRAPGPATDHGLARRQMGP